MKPTAVGARRIVKAISMSREHDGHPLPPLLAWIVTFGLIAVAVVVIAISGTTESNSSATPPLADTTVSTSLPTPEPPVSATDCSARFGGPYSMRKQLPQDKLDDKIEAFRTYKDGLPFSQSTDLTDINKLADSVNQNLMSSHGLRAQLYNYVITPLCRIIVAEWTENAQSNKVTGALPACPGGRDFLPVGNVGTMINFFPEDLGSNFRDIDRPARQSPCWLDLDDDKAPDKRSDGLLDTLSKHFMLAQVQTANATIKSFNERAWPDTEVAYAGEILVDPKGCTFFLNGGSGTYRPDLFRAPTVTAFFADKLNQGSLTLSGIGTWC